MFYTVVQRGFREMARYLFCMLKEFSKSVNSWWSYCKKFDTTLFWNTGHFWNNKPYNGLINLLVTIDILAMMCVNFCVLIS